ncbi:MAG: protease inhibitor I42 family protein [Anaerolineaceae bacterium]|nr:protease inhibitor I42 family protein [Anaerolineaceae bacterium]
MKQQIKHGLLCLVMIAVLVTSSGAIPAGQVDALKGMQAPPAADAVSWIVEIDVPRASIPVAQGGSAEDGAVRLERQIAGVLPPGVPLNAWVTTQNQSGGALYTIHIEGKSLDVMRLVVFDLLVPIVDVMGMPILYTIGGSVRAGDTLNVLLSGIPASGSEWMLDQLGGFFNVRSSEYECEAVGVGSPVNQEMVLEILKSGLASLRLMYQRAWELLEYFPVRITIQYGSLSGTLDLSDPNLEQFGIPELSLEPEQLSVSGVPDSFDWSTSNNSKGANMMTAVKNQGNCGSCWSFAAVGAMEAVMKIQGQGDQDLAEQYLVSCNNDGWSCGGGWAPHDYHASKGGKQSNAPGAVFESDFAYTAQDTTCKNISNHPYALSSWGSVNDDVDSLKAALYEYGPLWTTVCADGWGSYSGGVFRDNNCSQVNHAVVLVGWDDSTESWKIKNSWGSGWGEGGYMRIGWGVNGIGQYSSYVVYGGENVLPDETATPKPTNTPTKTPVPDGKDDKTATPTLTATTAPTDAAPTDTSVPTATKESQPDDETTEMTATPSSFGPGFYDDNEGGMFLYKGDWFVYHGEEPWKKTTHFSNQTGNQFQFEFNGSQFSLGFTEDLDQGVIKVEIDHTLTYYLNQFDWGIEWQTLWQSPLLGTGPHQVTITHAGGNQVNFDYLVIE